MVRWVTAYQNFSLAEAAVGASAEYVSFARVRALCAFVPGVAVCFLASALSQLPANRRRVPRGEEEPNASSDI